MTTILGLRLNQRNALSLKLQEILTQFGCIIKTRIGLHDVHTFNCPTSGIILLEIIDDKKVEELEKNLLTIEEIEVQKMVF